MPRPATRPGRRPADSRRSPTRSRSGAASASRGRSCRSRCRSLLLVFGARLFLNIDVERVIQGIANANRLLLLAAFGVFYLGFPLRGLRWAIILRGTGVNVSVTRLDRDHLPVVARELPRARRSSATSTGRTCSRSTPPVSLTRTFGTVFIERILDLFAIAILGLAAGFWSFRSGPAARDPDRRGARRRRRDRLAGLLFTLRNFGRRILVRLPLPHRVLELYDRFEEGVFQGVGRAPAAGSRDPHGGDLDDRGDAPVPGRPGPRVPGRARSGSRARSSSR